MTAATHTETAEAIEDPEALVRTRLDRSMRNGHLTQADHDLIATMLGLSETPEHGRRRRGVDTRAGKISPGDRQVIRDRYRAGEKNADIAADLGVSKAAVSYHCRGIDREQNLAPCGTNAAFQRHRYRGETPCEACVEARTASEREYRQQRLARLKESA